MFEPFHIRPVSETYLLSALSILSDRQALNIKLKLYFGSDLDLLRLSSNDETKLRTHKFYIDDGNDTFEGIIERLEPSDDEVNYVFLVSLRGSVSQFGRAGLSISQLTKVHISDGTFITVFVNVDTNRISYKYVAEIDYFQIGDM